MSLYERSKMYPDALVELHGWHARVRTTKATATVVVMMLMAFLVVIDCDCSSEAPGGAVV